MLGFLGGRKDHELINFAEAHSYLKNINNSTAVHFDKSISAYSQGKWTININGTFSLFAFEPLRLQVSGECEYLISKDIDFKHLSSHGLSNVGNGEVAITCDGPIFLFR